MNPKKMIYQQGMQTTKNCENTKYLWTFTEFVLAYPHWPNITHLPLTRRCSICLIAWLKSSKLRLLNNQYQLLCLLQSLCYTPCELRLHSCAWDNFTMSQTGSTSCIWSSAWWATPYLDLCLSILCLTLSVGCTR